MTKKEEIFPRQKGFREKIDIDLLSKTSATHVLTGIEWGAMATITCEDQLSEGEDITKVKGGLQGELEKLKVSVKGSVNVNYDDNSKSKERSFTYYSKSDVYDKQGDIPVSFEEAVQQAKKLPTYLQSFNGGKGVAVTFNLMPLKSLMKQLKVEASANTVYQALREDSVQQCVQIVDEAASMKQKLYDLKTDLSDNSECIPDDVMNEAKKLYDKFSVEEKKFKEDLRDALVKVRSKEEKKYTGKRNTKEGNRKW